MSSKKSSDARAAPEPEEEEEDLDLEEGEDDGLEFDEGEEMGDFGMDIGAMLDPYLATEDGDTVATALVSISKHMENQNKILIKILSAISASIKKA